MSVRARHRSESNANHKVLGEMIDGKSFLAFPPANNSAVPSASKDWLPRILTWGTSPRLRFLLTLYFLLCIGFFAVRTAHWKQVNDPAQLHYLCFLMDH